MTSPHLKGQFVVHRLGLAMINLHTKFEVSYIHSLQIYETQCKM